MLTKITFTRHQINKMKKILLLLFITASGNMLLAQSTTSKKNPHSGDHFMLQISSDHWLGAPDSISSRRKGLSRGFNAYIMLDKAFKKSPKYSLGLGLGISNSNIYFDKYSIEIKGSGDKLLFKDLEKTERFKKYKLATTFVELPLELRFNSNPENPNKSFKFAIGGKIGLLVNAHTKGKNLQDNTGRTLNEYTEKISSRRFFNTNRISATARAGFGNFSLFGSYALTGIFKENVAANMYLLQVGLTISGL